MADRERIHISRQSLEDKSLDLVTIIRMCDSLAGDNPPDWLAAMFGRVLELDRAVQDYLMAVHEVYHPALPVGDGGAAPSDSGSRVMARYEDEP